MSFEAQLAQIADLGHSLSHAELKILSDLGPASLQTFIPIWRTMPTERRLRILQDLTEISEDNLDLNFRAIFLVGLEDGDAEVRAAAVAALWEETSEAIMDRLLRMLNDEAGPVRSAACVALSPFAYRAELGELAAPAVQRLLMTLLRIVADPEQPLEVRRRAVESLGYFAGSKEAQAEIGRAYAHSELMMRESAILAMGRSMRPTWLPYLERELKSPSPALRYEAARAVGELGEDGRPLLTALLPLVDDDDTEISLVAIWSLGQVGGPSARRLLERLARSRHDARRQAASEALEELGLDEL